MLQNTPITGYKHAIACLDAKGVIVSSGYTISNLRDGRGYCVPKNVNTDTRVHYIGYVDNHRRPALIVQNEVRDFPKGNSKLTLDSMTKITLPDGAWLLDAEEFERFLSQSKPLLVSPD